MGRIQARVLDKRKMPLRRPRLLVVLWVRTDGRVPKWFAEGPFTGDEEAVVNATAISAVSSRSGIVIVEIPEEHPLIPKQGGSRS